MKRISSISQETKQLTEEEANNILNKIKKKSTATDEDIINEIFGNLFKEMEEMGQEGL